MIEIAVGLLALIFLAYLIRYVIQLTDNNARLFAFTKRGYELELELTRARINQARNQTDEVVQIGQTMWKGFRRFHIVYKVKETRNVVSIYLAPLDGRPLPPFLPGQYLTFGLNVPGRTKPVIRCYSLSDSPNHPDYYRVTVKRRPSPPDAPDAPPGLSSGFIHDSLTEKDVIDVKAPSGRYNLDMSQTSPVVLIAGGIGVTPLLSMLNSIAEKNSREKPSNRKTWFFLGCRNRLDHVMKDHIERTAKAHKNISLHVCYSNPMAGDILGRDYHHRGRVTVKLLTKILPPSDFDFYLCGPPRMMEDFHDGLGRAGVPEDKLHFETFNSAAIDKIAGTDLTQVESSLKVTFAKSQKTLQWNPLAGSLLAFAEENGIILDSGCRTGKCGSCATNVKRGFVTYLMEPGKNPGAGSCLTCISIPKTDLILDG